MSLPKTLGRSSVLASGSSATLDKMDESALGLDAEEPVLYSMPIPSTADRLRRRSDRPSFVSALRPTHLMQTHSPSPAMAKELAASAETLPGVSEGEEKAADADAEAQNSAAALGIPQLQMAEPVSEASRRRMRLQGRVQYGVLCWVLFLQGWNDGSTGPLLPTIQRVYGVNYSTVSLIFIFGCMGYIGGAVANIFLSQKLGFGKVMFLGAVCASIGFSVEAVGPPFPALVAAYTVAGFGISAMNASANVFVGSLKEHRSTKLSFMHASYGIGAFASPLAATHFAVQRRWSFHFLLSLGIAVTVMLVVAGVYRGKTMERLMQEAGQEADPTDAANAGRSQFGAMFKIKVLHLFALFALVYVGAEVTLGGWIVTFIIKERGGGPSSGYISSGFFGGLALGRVLLIGTNRLIGEARALVLYAILSMGLEATIWAVPSLIENAVAVSFIGVLLGPMYPILMNQASRVLPRWLLPGCVGWISGVGTAGAAILPFITGVLASQFGISSLQPFLLSMMVLLVCVWATIPKAPPPPSRRAD